LRERIDARRLAAVRRGRVTRTPLNRLWDGGRCVSGGGGSGTVYSEGQVVDVEEGVSPVDLSVEEGV
jgi:hypothetical protein